MDTTPTTAAAITTNTKSPELAPTTTTTKALSFSNGVLKRRHHHHGVVVSYKKCLKNHAATLGGYALDGCGEFMPSPNTTTTTDPTSIKCAACGCHRNFHRREPEEPPLPISAATYQPQGRHHPPPPPFSNRSPNSASPPPISSSYYPSAPYMFLGLPATPTSYSNMGRKRFRTKFSQEQKEKMREFAERVGWKMQKTDADLVHEFCGEVGVDRTALKVWMHNNKNTFGKRDCATNGDGNVLEEQPGNKSNGTEINGNGAEDEDPNHHYQNDGEANVVDGGVNGWPSSS